MASGFDRLDEFEVSAEQAVQESGDGVLLLDVRERDEWDRGHAPAAVLIPMSELGNRLDELPLEDRILVVCHVGQRSSMVASGLRRMGYETVSVAGGMVAWDQAGGVIESDGPEPARVD
jgi:rhodanese-related sulfurtransferase